MILTRVIIVLEGKSEKEKELSLKLNMTTLHSDIFKLKYKNQSLVSAYLALHSSRGRALKEESREDNAYSINNETIFHSHFKAN